MKNNPLNGYMPDYDAAEALTRHAPTQGGETADSPTFYPTCRFCGKQTLPVEKYASAEAANEAAKTARQRLVQSYG